MGNNNSRAKDVDWRKPVEGIEEKLGAAMKTSVESFATNVPRISVLFDPQPSIGRPWMESPLPSFHARQKGMPSQRKCIQDPVESDSWGSSRCPRVRGSDSGVAYKRWSEAENKLREKIKSYSASIMGNNNSRGKDVDWRKPVEGIEEKLRAVMKTSVESFGTNIPRISIFFDPQPNIGRPWMKSALPSFQARQKVVPSQVYELKITAGKNPTLIPTPVPTPTRQPVKYIQPIKKAVQPQVFITFDVCI